jgi:hypothetical protein
MVGMSQSKAVPRPSQTPAKKRRLLSRTGDRGMPSGAYIGSTMPAIATIPVIMGISPRMAVTT